MEALQCLHVLYGDSDTPYENHSELLELVGKFVLPTGITRDLRILLDLGATNNFLHNRIRDQYGIRMQSTTVSSVTMGDRKTARSGGETVPLTMRNGRFRHRSTYTLLDLGEYDVVLGMPFFRYHKVVLSNGGKLPEVTVKTPQGPRSLPVRIGKARDLAIFQVSTVADLRMEVGKHAEYFQLVLKQGFNDPSLGLEMGDGSINFEWVPPENQKRNDTETLGNDKATLQNSSPKISGIDDKNCQSGESYQPTLTLPPNPSRPNNMEEGGTGIKLEPESYELWELRQLAKFHRTIAPKGGGDCLRPRHLDRGLKEEKPNPLDQIARPKGIPELETLLSKYKDVFPEDLPARLPPEREISMRIPVQVGSTPPCQAPYRVHEEAKKTVEETLKYLYEHGLARDSFSEYGAPVTLAKKSDGTWRFCTDYRKLNAITKQAKYPLPRIDECLDHLRGAKYFSKLDLRSGYWQVRIHPEDVEKTAFRTHMGHHEWLVVPFGLQGAPSCFQRLMNHYLRAYIGRFVIVYLDDILIYSKTKEEHLEHLEKVLRILQEKELYAKPSKCDLFKTKVHFLGFIVENSHIKTDPEKVQVMRDWKIPTTVRELRSFLGLCNFYRKFVQGFSTWAKPLTDILKSTEFKEKFGIAFTKTAPITLNPTEIEAVNSLKRALTEAPVLVIYDPNKPTEVWADASKENQTVGAALMQDHGKGLQPVAYCSTVMDKHQIHYPTFEQELLALKTAFEEWRHYLLPLVFKARTDHNGLKYLKTQKHLSDRQWQWLGFFNEYQFELIYRPGAKMQVPDALSRRPHSPEELEGLLRICNEDGYNANDIEITVQTNKGPTKVCFNLEIQKTPDTPKLDIHTLEYKDDPDFGEIVQILKDGDSKTIQERPSLQLYLWEDGTLYWLDRSQNNRICVPKKNRVQVLKEFHDSPTGGHFGLEKTLSIIRRYFYWPNMKQFINDYVTTCDLCQKHKVWTHKRYRNPKLPEIPFEPWSTVSIDFCGTFPKTKKGNDEVCAATCVLTGEAILTPCQSTITAGGTAKLYMDHIFRFKGVPQKIISDRGPQFIAEFWKNFWKLLGTTTALTASYHPQSNPVERLNLTYVQGLKSFINARQDDWDDKLILFEFAYNGTPNPISGQTPFFLNMGRHPRVPAVKDFKVSQPAVEDYVRFLHNEIAFARDCLLRSQAYNADHTASNFANVKFEAGDLVLLSTENLNLQLPSKKFQPRYIGPLKILQIRGENTVVIEVPPRLKRLDPLQNIQHLRPYKTRPAELGPQRIELPPDLVEGEEEYEVEDILAHRFVGKRLEYLTRFKSYGPEEDLWLPARNLKNSPEILEAYHARNPLENPKPKDKDGTMAKPTSAPKRTRSDGPHARRH